MSASARYVANDACLWGATLAHGSLADRVQAAVAGGFATTTMFPHDYQRARDAGLTDADILSLHGDAGVRLRTLDPFTRWVPHWEPPADTAADRLRLVSCAEEEFFEITKRLQIETITAIEPFGVRHTLADLASAFGDLCDRAADQRILVHLEFTPFSGIPDLATAWDVVRTADRRNGGLVFDTWHYFRGDRDDALLREIPGEWIFAVQISDAAAQPRDRLVVDTWRFRRLPGEGEFELPAVLEILASKRGIGPPGIEVLSDELWREQPAEIGRLSGAALALALEPMSQWGHR